MDGLHPVIVHFPVALLLTAFLVETLALLLKKPAWHRISLWNLVLGTLAAGAAVITGRLAMAVAKHSHEIYDVMEKHERLGYLILALALLITGWRLLTKDRLPAPSRWLAWVMLAVTCGTMAFSAHLGGRLVYEFGVGGSYGRSGEIEMVR